jgi:hypothetical protein
LGLGNAAKSFDVPTILTTVVEDRGGKLIKGLQDVFPVRKPSEMECCLLAVSANRPGSRFGKGHFRVVRPLSRFFYDCPPIMKKMHKPTSKKAIDFSKTDQAVFRLALHAELRKKRKMALRLGHLIETVNWKFKPAGLQALLRGGKKFEELQDEEFALDTNQKGVDMLA